MNGTQKFFLFMALVWIALFFAGGGPAYLAGAGIWMLGAAVFHTPRF